jgi:hypothetical protein
MVFFVETTVFGTKTLFSEAATIFSASGTAFSMTEKKVGEAPTLFVTTNQSTKGASIIPQRIRIAERFKKQSAEQLVAMAGAVITGLTNNIAFPAPPVDLKAAQAAADDLNAALAAQVHGGAAATAEKRNKKKP